MKYCKACDAHKDLADFSVNRQTKDGLEFYCKACKKAASAAHYKKNKTKANARSRAWAKVNPESAREAERAWHARNKENVAAYNKAWAQANPHMKNAAEARRRSAKLLRTPGWLTAEDFAAIEFTYAWAKVLEASTGIPHHVDHVYPLQGRYVSGLHVPANLQVLTASENRSKHNKWIPV